MTIRLSVKSNFRKVLAELRGLEKEVHTATAIALTRTAVKVKSAEIAEMKKVFDRPTSYTLNSVYVTPATRATLSAKIWLKDEAFKGTPAEVYLSPNIFGGGRRLKRFEQALQARGLLPAGMAVVPGAKANLDSHGNLRGSQVVQILAALRAMRDPYSNASGSKRSLRKALTNQVFVGRPGGGKLPLGVWQRQGMAVRPLLIFVRRPTYRQRFDFFGVGVATAEREFPTQFDRALDERLGGWR